VGNPLHVPCEITSDTGEHAPP